MCVYLDNITLSSLFKATLKTLVDISAINATQVEVKFGAAVDKTTVFSSTNLINNTNFAFTSIDGLTLPNAPTGELSKDGKTLVITANANSYQKRVRLVIDNLTSDGEAIEKYDEVVDFGEDKTAPTIKAVNKLSESKYEVVYSEPVTDASGNWSFKDAEGNAITTGITVTHTAGTTKTVIALGGAIDAGKVITGTVIGVKDGANNLINPNPSTITMAKGAKDGVRPTVVSITPKGLTKFDIKFSEEVNVTATDVKVGGTAVTSLDQDENDKTKYEATIAGTITAGLHAITVEHTVTDLSGESIHDTTAYSKLVEFKADTVLPKLVSSEVIRNASNEEVLVLTFDKEVAQPGAAFATANNTATELDKNFVTTTKFLDAGQLTVNATNAKKLEVVLNTVTFDTSQALKKDATYTVNFKTDYVVDATTSTLKTKPFSITFKRGEDGTPVANAPKVNTVAPGSVDANNQIDVTFDSELDGVTATNVANYTIPGLVIEKATLKPFASTQVVTLTLKKGTNTINGDRNLTIKNVKAKDGKVMDTVTKLVTGMKENVAPTVISAKFTGVSGGLVDEITLTFSEDVKTAAASLKLFDVYIGETKVTAANVANADMTTAGNKVVITLSTTLLSTEDIAKGITIKFADNMEKLVLDTNGNILDFTSIKATY